MPRISEEQQASIAELVQALAALRELDRKAEDQRAQLRMLNNDRERCYEHAHSLADQLRGITG
jgi:uncharacterized protein (DUF488 family)